MELTLIILSLVLSVGSVVVTGIISFRHYLLRKEMETINKAMVAVINDIKKIATILNSKPAAAKDVAEGDNNKQNNQ